ncbi:hypothetical protein SELMODRAFT_408789 [Selaginella moellendorffii]|uniref:Uncharacterized protein n=1 Tax=Selaginella moellendorffii TaxID=88036 RepID=D8R9Z4_SELML|nr:hypothetical protein SELMODRAFT_408789 [Selaginella moellendorffii]
MILGLPIQHGRNETLARGIEWLATLVPAQPELHAVDLRDLVAEKLYSTLNSSREETKAGPGDYVFSKALHDATAEVAARASGVSEHFLDEADASQQRASPTVYLLREISFHRDVVGDYKKSLAFASRLQGGNFPESIQVSFVERYNQQYTETACDTATSKPEDVMLRHELKYLRSGDELELLPKAVLPQPEPEARLDELVARLDKRLDENTQAAATGLEEIPQPWTEDTKLLVLTPEGIDLEVLEVTSPRSSSSDSYKRFNELLSS